MKFRTTPVWFCFFIFTFCTGALHAQEFLAKGVVLDKTSRSRIALAEIVNQRSGNVVGSDVLGFFKIMAAAGDTLVFQKRNFRTVKVAVADTKDIIVHLVPLSNTIDEVVITSQSKKQQLDEIRKDYRDKGTFYGGKPPLALLSPFGGSPLTFLYELFGRTPRNARRFERHYRSELQETKIDGFFNEALISANTGLTGKALNQFMLDYRPEFGIAQKWNTYDAIKYIKESYKKYADTAGK